MDLRELKKQWAGQRFDTAEFSVSVQEILEYSAAVGEIDPRFSDPGHPDFQAPPTYSAKFVSRRIFPKDFPRLARRGFDAGKCVIVHGPIRAGETLTATSMIADIYEKTGRSGAMIFIVHRMEFSNPQGELVSVVDWRLVQQPDPE